MMIALLNVGTS